MPKSNITDKFWWLIPIIGLASIVGAFWAWLRIGFAWDDALYRSLTIARLGFYYADLSNPNFLKATGLAPAPNDALIVLRIARATGSFAAFAAAFWAVVTILEGKIINSISRSGIYDIVVIGEGEIAKFAAKIKKSKSKFLHIGAGENSKFFQSSAIKIDDKTKDLLPKYLKKAKNILVAMEEDTKTLEYAKACADVNPNANITAIMEMNGNVNFSDERAFGNLRLISQGSLAAREIHVEHPPFANFALSSEVNINALIIGFGETGFAILRDILANCKTSNWTLPTITYIDPNANIKLNNLRINAPEIDKECKIVAIDGGFGGAFSAANINDANFTSIYVCLSDDAITLEALSLLEQWLRLKELTNTKIFARMRNAVLLDNDNGNIVPFGSVEALVEYSNFSADDPDFFAKEYHEAYRNSLSDKERNDPDNEGARPWEELAETFRSANRAAIMHMPAKIYSAGHPKDDWTKNYGVDAFKLPKLLYVSEAENLELARLEHGRWNAERRLNGWREGGKTENGKLKKDTDNKRHPSLKDFDELDEVTKSYDVKLVEKLKDLLAYG